MGTAFCAGVSRRTTGGRRGASRRTMGFLNDRLGERRTGLDLRTFLKKEGGFAITFFTLLLLLRGEATIRHGVEAGEATILRGVEAGEATNRRGFEAGEATIRRGVEGDFTVRRGGEATILRGDEGDFTIRRGVEGGEATVRRGEDFLLILRAGLSAFLTGILQTCSSSERDL